MLTQPDRPAGRGMRTAASAVKQLALGKGLEVFQPASLKDDKTLERIAAARPEALVVAAYGLLLPPRALQIAPLGALNIHASLLPRWRGAAPIQRALLAGDGETGITIMQMDAGLDTGAMLLQRPLAINAHDDAQSLHDRLAQLGAESIVAALDELAAERARAAPQPADGVTYAHKIGKQEAELDWTRSCVALERAVRALRPQPGARTQLGGVALKLWRASCADAQGAPGTVLRSGAEGVLIACGEGALLATELQRAGGARLPAADFLRGFPIDPGVRLGAAR